MSGFHWFRPEQTAKITADLVAAGEGARLEIHPTDDHGILARVVPAGVAALDDSGTNHSVHCPPICP